MQSPNSERSKNGIGLDGWLIILVVLSMFIFDAIDLFYRHSLPTDGWAIGEAGDVTFLRDNG